MRTKFVLELNGVKVEPFVKLMYDTIRYTDVCFNAGLHASAIEAKLDLHFDINDCNLGGAGIILWILSLFNIVTYGTYGYPYECKWKNYRFNTPLIRLALDTFGVDFKPFYLTFE